MQNKTEREREAALGRDSYRGSGDLEIRAQEKDNEERREEERRGINRGSRYGFWGGVVGQIHNYRWADTDVAGVLRWVPLP